ncbi:unnamed protein product [Linum tenue]|uniref:Trichome birefringence-like N-terminal domain-containing protein n=1 Tax=Linum tenue TaxID=586396 RepID=A0AAV0MU12_9ROSI|nr:unnamed protein product [Linum tenue]
MAIISSNLNNSWKLCIFGSFIGCFLTLLCLDYHGYSSFDIVSGVLPSGNPIFDRFFKPLKPSCGEGGFIVKYPTLMSGDDEEKQDFVVNNQTSMSTGDDEEKQNIVVSNQTSISTGDEEKPEVAFMNRLSEGSNEEDKLTKKEKKKKKNLFDGRWVYDPNGNPDYRVEQCPFLSGQVSCQRNGRPDSQYQKWSWQPEGYSNFPRFNATNMLELLRGKRVVIVGDSLNRNQWESLACLLYSALPPSRCHVGVVRSDYKVFKSLDYNCSVEFFWSPFLVQLEESRGPKPRNRRRRILKLDKISASAPLWLGADIMVFNSGHWWTHPWKIRAWDFFENNGKLVKQMEIESAFQTAVSTWAKWIDHNLNSSSTKTSVFFRSISPEHKVQGCSNSTEPLDGSYDDTFPHQLTDIVTRTIDSMRTPVRLLNVTKLSGYRIDAHPAIYSRKQDQTLIRPDCSHWCLPGLPDTWNTLIYAMFTLDRQNQN